MINTRISIFLVLLFVGFAAFPQQNDWDRIDQKVAKVPASAEKSIPLLASWIKANFIGEKDRIRAIHRWIAVNLVYDFNSSIAELTKKENQEIIASAFRTRKSVCGGYAGLMDSLCVLAGIHSYVIDGYTIQDGKINPNPHAWIAAEINQNWFLFDPTWSSGSLVNGTYEHEFDESYFMVSSEKMILSHIPFDPIWQFLRFPQFSKNNKFFQTKTAYDFEDSIDQYLQLSDKQRITNEIRRIGESQTTNQAIVKRLSFLYDNLDVELYNENINLYNQAIQIYNAAVSKWDDYINFRNKNLDNMQSIKKKSPVLDELIHKLDKASAILQQMVELPSDLANGVFSLRKSIKLMKSQVQDEQQLMKRS